MTLARDNTGTLETIFCRADFNVHSGGFFERLFFNHRRLVIAACALLTVFLGFEASKLGVNASFEDMMPQAHPYAQNYLEYKDSLRGLGNSVRIVVENTSGDIYNASYLERLRQINDKVYLIPGVDRSFVKSLWMPVVRWQKITTGGWEGGPVMSDTYDGSESSLAALRANIYQAGIVGSLVGNDERSSMIFVPLLERYGDTGQPLDYKAFRDEMESVLALGDDQIRVRIIGFAQLAGDLIYGLNQVITYFAYAALISMLVLYAYARCVRSTALVIGCSLVAVVWQLGVMRLLGLALDPYSTLVPFLIFAIGVSHGAQKINGVMQDIGRGTDRYVAARYTFRRLFLAGATALLADAVGFAVLTVIDVPAVRGLALSASIGVAALIFTNLVLIPVMLSYVGVGRTCAARSLRSVQKDPVLWRLFGRFTDRPWAVGALATAAALGAGGLIVASHLNIGDLDPGAPELHADSRYNRDNAYITKSYGLSSDQFAIIVATPEAEGLTRYETLLEMDRLEEQLRDLPSVRTTVSVASLGRNYTAGGFEGTPKWITINRDPAVNYDVVTTVFQNHPEAVEASRRVAPVIAFLTDHKAETLERVVHTVETFSREHNSDSTQFLLAAGTAGIEATTNLVVAQANRVMLLYVYGAVILLAYITFRTWRAVIVAVLPLILTSILCEALMVILGIGVKVSTLPVVALGVGIGIDYALYLLTVQLAGQRQGKTVAEAYRGALAFTGKVVALIGVTLAAAVITWAWSPIKFQADMGILLAFMFFLNMLGALILIPSLATFLLAPSRVSGRRRRAFPRSVVTETATD